MAKKAKKARKTKTLDPALPIFQLKITLQYLAPPVWRRVQTNDCTLDELHDIIQVSMGWEDAHMYAFVVEGEQYAILDYVDAYAYRDSRTACLSSLVEQGCRRFRYDYDFGDDWTHVIEIEKSLSAEQGVYYPRCVKGKRACPPEDCGGPYNYPYFLDSLEDPTHEDHEDALEWVGSEFDPEQFDLDEVNERLRYLRRWLGDQNAKKTLQAAFAEGELVRVKPGIVHDRYPDIPLGGWVGTVDRIGWLTPVAYDVDWTEHTLDQAHQVFIKRCRRDELTLSAYWLEEDQIEKVGDDVPAAMEQPTNIITRQISVDEPLDRIRMVFGLTTDDGIPKGDAQTQRRYLDYLKAHLVFPFNAEYWPKTEIGPREPSVASVLGIADSALELKAGILCKARSGERDIQLPLAGLQIRDTGPNVQLVDDYTRWMWDCQELGNDDEDHDDYDDDDEDEFECDDEMGAAPYPIGTIANYGPDDKTTTKIVAGVFSQADAEPILKRWVATDVTTDPRVREEIANFFEEHGVTRVGASDGNMGCPHEEGEDFPVGGDCPFCPYWKGKQGSGRRD